MRTNRDKICVGAGLVSLDILMRGNDDHGVSFKVGGTCGNVMMILSHMGWSVYPIARLDETDYAKRLLADMKDHHVNTKFVSTNDGTTPVIVQRNVVDKYGNPCHKFEILNNRGRFFLGYKSITRKQAEVIISKIDFTPAVFFFDRVSPAVIHLAEHFKSKGSLIYFEPSCKVTENGFLRCVELSDIIKFAKQRISDITYTSAYQNKLFIQTLGQQGLQYSLRGQNWVFLEPIVNNNLVDTSGAGDWTTSAFLNGLMESGIRNISKMTPKIISKLLMVAQEVGSRSCSYEGARGMMTVSFE
jgi:fructokinase